MVFKLFSYLSSPEAGRKALNGSYEKHYKFALKQGIEPISYALLGTLVSRYKLRRRYVSEQIHVVEITPFMMMETEEGRERLIDYILYDEIPQHIDYEDLKDSINKAFRKKKDETAEEAYALVVTSLPHLRGAGIQWFSWLDEKNVKKLEKDVKREYRV